MEAKCYRFNVAGNYSLQGVGTPYNKRVNFVYPATAPFSPRVPRTPDVAGQYAITNIMVCSGSEVEDLLDTTDEFYPTYKQRLGFELDPDINRDNYSNLKGDGNELAPFSLYKTDEYYVLSNVPAGFKSGVAITNLHHDFVADNGIPAQGPFTEEFVGGRRYRHTEINQGSDTALNRAEGWKIQFSGVSSSAGGTFAGSLAVIPPNYTGRKTDTDIPTAQHFRPEVAKRPVNFKNILMTTASTDVRLTNIATHNKIGNYEKNYQVIQTSGRSSNDPFFNDQSFDFARYPETLATRGRFPLVPQGHKSLHFDGANDYVRAGTAADWEDAIGGAAGAAKAYSISAWINADAFPAGYFISKLGSTGGYSMSVLSTGNISFMPLKTGTNPYVRSSALTTGTWYHIVATLGAGAGNKPNMYVNGALDNATLGSATTSNNAIDDILVIGDASTAFDGYICDFAVWNKELTAADVLTIYNNGTRVNLQQVGYNNRNGDLTSGDLDNLVAWWPLGDDPRDGNSAGTFYDQMAFANGAANNFNNNANSGIAGESPRYGSYGGVSNAANARGNLDYKLPQRIGTDSNQTIFVNRFSAPGSYEVESRGYLDPAHEELSVYNALPYRNRGVIDYGLSGSASADTTISQTSHVVGQLNHARGLNQRASLHSALYGIDSAYGSVTATSTRVDGGLGYSITPAWHKTNRNALMRMETASVGEYTTGSVYDNLFVQHAIPRSTQQYAWVTASLTVGEHIFGLQPPTCYSAGRTDYRKPIQLYTPPQKPFPSSLRRFYWSCAKPAL